MSAQDQGSAGVQAPVACCDWRRETLIALGIVAATVAVQLGAMLLIRSNYAYTSQAIGTLAVSAVWVALAAPVLAASARGWVTGLLRGGLTADGTFITMLVLWWMGRGDERGFSFLNLLQMYLTYLTMALAASALVHVARRVENRFAVAAPAAALMLALLATPFYADGVRAALPASWQPTAVSLAVYLNPFYSIASATATSLGYVVTQAPFMYSQVSMLGEHAPPPCPWWAATAVMGGAAAVFLLIIAMRRGSNPAPSVGSAG